MIMNEIQILDQLRAGALYLFADWPNRRIDRGRAGVYTVWRDNQFIYVGMGGLNIKSLSASTGNRVPKDLWDRLNTHASGQRGGDQFCIYVFDRLVLPDLSRQQITDAADGQLSLNHVTRDFIQEYLTYRYVLMGDGRTALALEEKIRRVGLAGRLPLLNPKRGR